MENKFNIDSDEKRRILSLHENATKQQYLNLINEIGAGGEGDMSFDPAQYDYSNVVKTPTKQFNGLNYTLQNGQTFISAVGGNKINVPSQTIVTVDQTNKKLNIGKYFKFGCKPITVSSTPFYYTSFDGKKNYGNEGSALTNILRKRYCKGTELKSNEEILGKNQQGGGNNYVIQNPHTLNKGALKIVKGDIATKSGNNVVIKRGNTVVTSMDCKSGKFNTGLGQTDADGGNVLRDTLMKKFCGSSAPSGGKVPGGKVPIVIPKDIDLSQITKDLPPELQTVLTPPTVDGQPNTSNTPDFNQLLTQLQGLQ